VLEQLRIVAHVISIFVSGCEIVIFVGTSFLVHGKKVVKIGKMKRRRMYIDSDNKFKLLVLQ
jgi:hypothetical protein